jgi:hypothetical protein
MCNTLSRLLPPVMCDTLSRVLPPVMCDTPQEQEIESLLVARRRLEGAFARSMEELRCGKHTARRTSHLMPSSMPCQPCRHSAPAALHVKQGTVCLYAHAVQLYVHRQELEAAAGTQCVSPSHQSVPLPPPYTCARHPHTHNQATHPPVCSPAPEMAGQVLARTAQRRGARCADSPA